MIGQGTLSTRVVTNLREFETLSQQWNELARATAPDNIFLTWEWLYTWAEYYLDTQQLRLLLVYRGEDRLVGIAPFYIRSAKTYGGLSLRELRFLGTEEVCSAYLDFIVSERNKKAVLQQVYRYLHKESRASWDILTLPEMPAESSSIDIWDDLVQEDGKVSEIVGATSCPVIELPACPAHFLMEISSNERYNLQRKRKQLEKGGEIAYQRVCSPSEVERELDAFVHLHQMRWEQKGPGGAFQSQRFLMFHRDICRVFSQQGWVHLDFLLLNGEKIAGIYGYLYNGKYSFYLPGFNPTILAQASPGKLLLFHRIEEAIQERCTQVDLLRGAADYKLAWANGIRRCLTVRLYNKTRRAAALKLLESGKDIVKVLIR